MKHLKRALEISLAISSVALVLVIALEPVIVSAITTSFATATLTVTKEVTISSPSNTTFSASIPGVSGNPGAPVTASLTWTVITNDSSGFALNLNASQAHALYQDGTYYFADYTTTPTYNWTGPSSGNAAFGFTIAPATAGDGTTPFKDNGSACTQSGGTATGKCWSGFNSTTGIPVVNRSTPTSQSGEAEVVNFKAESNGHLLKDGSYAATVTATASLN